MALGDITLLKDGAFGAQGSRTMRVTSGTTASINAGEFVRKALGSAFVLAWGASDNAKPVVATDFLAGLSATSSNETASAAGTVEIIVLVPGQVFLAAPLVAATWDTQSEYNALVGDRVLLDSSASGVQTLLATDGATNGFVVEYMDITTYPNKVAFSARAGLSYLT